MEIIELLPRLHQVNLDFGQVYVWRDGDELTLVDTGIPGSGAAIASAVESLGLDRSAVRRIVVTHGHEDHAGSASARRTGHHRVRTPVLGTRDRAGRQRADHPAVDRGRRAGGRRGPGLR